MRQIWLVGVMLLVIASPLHAADIDDELVGVWIDTSGKNRIEISADGKLTLWSYTGRQARGWSANLKYESVRQLEMMGPGQFSMPILGPLLANPRNGTASFWHSRNQTDTFLRLDDDGKLKLSTRNREDVPISKRPIAFQYTIAAQPTKIELEISPVQPAPSIIRYEKLLFGEAVNGAENGSKALHDRQVVGAELKRALDSGDSSRFAKMIASSEANFLRDEQLLADKTTAANLISHRTFSEVIRKNDLIALKAIFEHTTIRPAPQQLSIKASDENKTYLWQQLGIDPNALTPIQNGLLNRLLIKRDFQMPPLQFKRLYARYGCERAHEQQFQNSAMQIESAEEKAEQEAVWRARLTDPGLPFQVTEEAFTLCLKNFDKGQSIPKAVLSAATIPAVQTTKGSPPRSTTMRTRSTK